MATLHEMLLEPAVKPQVITDSEALVNNEVSDLAGISGSAIKLAYRTVRTFNPGHIHYMIEQLLPSIADALQPYWADFNTVGGEFGDYLAKREDEVSEALLSITDERGRKSSRPTIVKAYNSVRGSAAKHVKAALPAVGALVEKYS
jgi:hypothetical protein